MKCLRLSGFVAMMILLSLVTLLGVRPVLASPSAQSGVRTGTVLAGALNVRDKPSLAGKVIGKVTIGTEVEIVDSEGDWLQIKFVPAADGTGWVSARFISTGASQRRPTAPARPANGAPAPSVVNYSFPNFKWTWPGAQLNDVDWYFDLQLFQSGASNPYKTIVVNPDGAVLRNGVYSYDAGHTDIKCNSYWVVQIAKRENGRFVGWISDKSNQQSIGDPCAPSRGSGGSSGSGSSGGSQGGGNTDGPVDLDGDGVCDRNCGG